MKKVKLKGKQLLKIAILAIGLSLLNSCEKDSNDDLKTPTEETTDVDTGTEVGVITTGVNTGVEAASKELERLTNVLLDETLTTNLNISVVDQDYVPVSNASVEFSGETLTTNAEGFAVSENVEINKQYQVIKTYASGFSTSIKTITPSSNGVTNVLIMLLRPSLEASFDAVDGGVISNDQFSLDFPENAIADYNGDLYNGEVNIAVTYYDPSSTTFTATIPGTLVGLDNDDAMQALISKGMIRVDLTNPSGEELEIFEGKEVAVKLPANENDSGNIDFWHLNEEKGIWVQTGTATKVGDEYVTTVQHFSTYNLDVKVDPIDITVSVKDADGNAIANQKAIITAATNLGSYSRSVYTDNLGEFTLINAPKGADFSLDFSLDCEDNFTVEAGIIDESTTKELVIGETLNSRLITLEGNLTTCENDVITDKFFVIEITNEGVVDRLSAYANEEGYFNVNTVLCGYDTTTAYPAEIRIYSEDELIVKNTELVFNTNNIKDLDVCDGEIIEFNKTINTAFDDYFVLSPNPTSDFIYIDVLDEDSIEIAYFLVYNLGGNIVGYHLGTTRQMNFSYLYSETYILEIHSNKGIFSTQFVRL